MKFQVKENCEGVPVFKLSGRAYFRHGGSWYKRVESCGQGVDLRHSKGYVVIMNTKCGTLREISATIHVEPFKVCNDSIVNLAKIPYFELENYLVR